MEITIHKEKIAISHIAGNKKGQLRVTKIPVTTLYTVHVCRYVYQTYQCGVFRLESHTALEHRWRTELFALYSKLYVK